ncbi:MAG TPA: ATP-binding protein [Bdellovibrionales bacterium]|nr:ATP-binding protein [Pseudobdellovibrionaceae bacterium]HAG92187.1 ATP-binding protein [Bdellovibrionales bacterium]|tara:strand:- start:856 stop:1542 length:687 start_codon:yes stop_codon:yes gene_type:complete
MIQSFDLIKEFGEPPQRILHGLNFKIETGEFVSISGKSGSGKSTLLYLISTLDLPTYGRVEIDGKDVAKMGVDEVHRLRNTQIGFIFQFHYLLPELTTLENVLLPARNLGIMDQKENRALELLDSFGILDQAHKYPGQMSGGQTQRVAIARALIMDPKYIFADEPTGNLDTENGERVMNILKRANEELGTTICMVTHDPDFAATAKREILLVDGRIDEIIKEPELRQP